MAVDMHLFPKRASLRGLESEIFKLVSYGATPDQWAEWLRVPLEHAAARGNLDLVNILIEAGADGSAGWRGCRGRTLLDAAALGGSADVITALLRAGARPDVKVVSMSPKRSALYVATVCGHVEAARRLIVAGADIEFEDPQVQCGVLHQAAYDGHERLVDDLLIGRADPNRPCKAFGATPLHEAAGSGHVEIVSTLLLTGADKDALDGDGDSAMMWAADWGHLAVVETLLKTGANYDVRGATTGYSALDNAAIVGHISVVKAILAHGARVNSCSDAGYTALHHAASSNQAGAIDALIEAGANIELKSTQGQTPLFNASEGDNRGAMLALLRHGADVRTCSHHGRTPLHQVCRRKRPGLELVVDLLLRWGADETALDDAGETPTAKLDLLFSHGYTCPLAEIERVRLLLARAPADRAWRRRCWLVMLRSRSTTKAEANGFEIGGETGSSSNEAGGREGGNLKYSKTDGGAGNSLRQYDKNGLPCNVGGKTRVGAGAKGAGLSDIVQFLVEVEAQDVFRTVLGFL
ncbi:unnamed protein product [Ectocarpus fasciculatus]